jgi:uncharacterized membrane protein
MFSKKPVRMLARAGAVAALYFALSVAVPALSFGAVQLRLGEALTLLPSLMPEAALGLSVGCFFANFFFSPFGWLDAVIGTAATLAAGLLTAKIKRLVPAGIPPVVLNALLVPIVFLYNKTDTLYYINVLTIFLSQSIMVYAAALPLTYMLKKAVPARFFE